MLIVFFVPDRSGDPGGDPPDVETNSIGGIEMQALTTGSRKTSQRLRGVLLPSLLLLLCAGSALAQSETARITGTVSDSTGAVVPDVEVVIIAVETNRRHAFVTDGAGRYSSGPLQVGAYRVEAELVGFKRIVREAITLEVQEAAVIDLSLELGETTESVTVTAAEALVNTSEASQGQVIEERRVKELPLNGRDYLQLALLSEGVVEPPGQGRSASGANGGGASRAGGYSAGAQRSTDNNYLLDGFDNNTDDTSFDNNQAETIKPSVDAVREFKVQANAYSAEFGRASGGVVNLTLKSGTNDLHGTAFWFLRDAALDARNFFDRAEVPPFERDNYGFTIGGPGVRNKLFFFYANEWLDRRESRTINHTIPTLAMRRGDFTELGATIFDPATFDPGSRTRQPFKDNIIPESRFDGVGSKVLQFFPDPQNTQLSRNFLFNPPDLEDTFRLNTRTDFHATDKDHFSWMLNRQTRFLNSRATLPAPAFGGNTRNTDVWAWSSGLTWTRAVSPTFFSTAKIGWDSNKFLIDFSEEAVALGDVNSQLGLSVPDSGLPARYPSFSLSGYSNLGAGNFLPVYSNGQTRQIKIDNNWIKGDHNFKFGVDAQWLQTNNINARRLGGSYDFTNRYTRNPADNRGGNTIADLLLGQVNRSRFSTVTRVDSRASLIGGYIQDTWNASPRLNVDLGVRYDFFQPFEDKFDQLASVDVRTGPPNTRIILSSNSTPPSLINTDRNNIQPRIGFAYQLIPEKVVIRTGYGIFYPLPRFSPFGDSDSIVVNPPYNVEVAKSSDGITPASILQNGIPADALALRNATSVSLASTERNPKFGNAQHWNFNIQYQASRNWMFQLGYFAAKGTHLAQKIDANDVESLGPGNINARRRFKSIFVPLLVSGATGPEEGIHISPIGRITRQEYNGNTTFHSLQAKAEHRFDQGFTLLGSWMWSKSIGDLIGDSGMGIAPSSGFQNPNDLRNERGLADTHLAHRLVVSGIWELPFGQARRFGSDLNPVLNAIFGGWSATTLVTLTTGRPYTIRVRGNPANSGQTNRADLVGDPDTVPGGRSVDEFFNTAAFRANEPFTYGDLGRNSLIGPGWQNVDASLLKDTTLFSASDNPWRLQFRWEVFNLFNHTNFGFPGTTLGTGTFGQLTNATLARKMQVGLKLIF